MILELAIIANWKKIKKKFKPIIKVWNQIDPDIQMERLRKQMRQRK